MDIFVFSDESGVFDKVHNDFFVFGGVLFLSKDDKDDQSRKYIHAEKVAKTIDGLSDGDEAKACVQYSDEESLMVGTVLGIRDSLNFHGKTVAEVKQSFHDSIDGYQEMCKELNREPMIPDKQ